MAKETKKATKKATTTKTLREEDILTKPQRRPATGGVPVRTGLRGGDKNANNGHNGT